MCHFSILTVVDKTSAEVIESSSRWFWAGRGHRGSTFPPPGTYPTFSRAKGPLQYFLIAHWVSRLLPYFLSRTATLPGIALFFIAHRVYRLVFIAPSHGSPMFIKFRRLALWNWTGRMFLCVRVARERGKAKPEREEYRYHILRVRPKQYFTS